MDRRISGDGSADECRHRDTGRESSAHGFADDERPDVYLSIFDPVGEPAFEPSKTKPLPKWMHFLPNNIHRDREQKGIGPEDQVSLKAAAEGSTLSGSITPTTPTTPQTQKDLPTPPLDIPNSRPHTRRTNSKITFEPHPECDPADGGHRGDRRSQTVESAYMTPLEYPRPKTPFPRPARPALTQRETTSYFSHIPESSLKDSWEIEDTCCSLTLTPRVPKPTLEQTSPREPLSPPLSERYRLLPSQSCEYLERYRPKSAATKHEKYIAKDPEPILSKLKRQRAGNQDLEQVADERKLKRHSQRARNPNLDNEEYDLDPRRKDLNQELRKLFCEE
jgi:hypothetical protein